MAKTDLAYMAGLFDGEGCVSIAKHSSNRYYNIACYLIMANEYLPQLFQFRFGGRVSRKYNHPNKPEWRPYWRWAISSQQAYRFLKTIYPYLILKKPQAEVAFKFIEEHTYQTGRHKLTEEQIALKEVDAMLMSSLNRGKKYIENQQPEIDEDTDLP